MVIPLVLEFMPAIETVRKEQAAADLSPEPEIGSDVRFMLHDLSWLSKGFADGDGDGDSDGDDASSAYDTASEGGSPGGSSRRSSTSSNAGPEQQEQLLSYNR